MIIGVDNDDEDVEIQGSSFTGLTRSDTLRMKRYDEIQAFTHIFRCDLKESSAKPVYVKHPVPPEIRTYLPNTVAVFPEVLG